MSCAIGVRKLQLACSLPCVCSALWLDRDAHLGPAGVGERRRGQDRAVVAHLPVGERSPQPARRNRTVGFACRLATRRAPHGGSLVAQVARLAPDLDAGRLCAVVAALRIHVETTPEARKCIHYLFGNRHRMRYPQFRARGLCVSSGVVEAGCKQIGDRLKRAGMRWTVAGANAIIALRCCILSGRFEDFWERRAANAA